MPSLLESIMGTVQKQRLAKNSHAPMPEIIVPGDWEVHGSAKGHGAVDLTNRVMIAPDDASAKSRRTRLHELTHTAISPAVNLIEEAESANAHLLVLQGCEDARVHGFNDSDEVLHDHLHDPEAHVFSEAEQRSLLAAIERAKAVLTDEGKLTELKMVGASLAMAGSHTPDEAFSDKLAELCDAPMNTIREARKMIDADPSWETVKKASGLVTEKVLFGEEMPEPEPMGMPGGEGDEGEETTYSLAPGEKLDELAEAEGEGEGEDGEDESEADDDSKPGDGGESPSSKQKDMQGDGKAPNQAGQAKVTVTKKKEEAKNRTPEKVKAELKKVGDEWVEWAASQVGTQGANMVREIKNIKKHLNSGTVKSTPAPENTGAERSFTNPLADLRAMGSAHGGTAKWGDMEIIKPKLVDPMKRIKKAMPDKRWTSTDESGRLNRRVARLHTDGMVLRRKRRGPKPKRKGSILVDASGSMGLTHAHLEKILHVVPMATVAFYSSKRGSNASGVLYIIAENGKMVHDIRAECPKGGGNVVDGPALQWLAKQKGPRVWVSDGWVTGKNESQAPNIYNEAADLCERHKIIRVPTLEMLLADQGFNYKIVM